jgi:4-diphosphocytidyl-2-C-methyl-D-erythritol kinase
MPVITERAPAKINLTLEIRGRRADGYHELLSLVAFAGVADTVTLDLDRPAGSDVDGCFGSAIATQNLVDVTLRLLQEAEAGLRLGHVHLTKMLPVAAGIGGGSADAAAVLRAVRRANPDFRDGVDWHELAARLGADVPVCLEARAAWMAGIGERVTVLGEPLPRLSAVLVNPMVPVPDDKTAQVFRLFDASSLPHEVPSAEGMERLRTSAELLRVMRERGNALEAAATRVVPEIAGVLAEFRALPGVEIARLSGGGPTCYGIFPSESAAEAAAAALKEAHPGWWVEATLLS